MNRKQKIAIVIGALVIAGLAFFPPKTEVGYARGPRLHIVRTGGVDRDAMHDYQLAALVLTVATVLVLRDKKA